MSLGPEGTSLFHGINLVTIIEPMLLGAALYAFARAKAFNAFPAFGFFLIFRFTVDLSLGILLQAAKLHLLEGHTAYSIYFYAWWSSYLAGAVVVFLVIQEVLLRLVKLLPGFERLASEAFRWGTLSSLLVAIALSIRPVKLNLTLLVSVADGAMRCVSVLELCLLAFVVIAMQTFRLSAKSWDFGITLGLALVAVSELFASIFAGHSNLTATVAHLPVIASIVASCIWTAYFLFAPQTAAKRAASSSLVRLSEVAVALGPPPPRVAYAASPRFFLQDVEKAVDRVLENNTANHAG